jgi:hypothetical protein
MSRQVADVSTSPPIFFSRIALLIAAVVGVGATMLAFLGPSWPLAIEPLAVDGFITLAWLAAATGIGSLVMRVLKLQLDEMLWLVCSAALGLGAMSLIVLGLGLAGALNRITAIGLVGIGMVIAFAKLTTLKPTLPRKWWHEPAGWNWLWMLVMPMLGTALLGALIPPGVLWGDEPNGYDVVEYHLQVPREWFEAGRIIPLTHNVFSFFPFNVEMHYLLAMHLKGGPWAGMYLAQLMHVAFVALTVLSIYALLAHHSKPAAIAACTIAGATPWFALLAPVAYNEGGLLLFGTLAIGLSVRAIRESNPLRWMILAGAFAGFACGSKLTAGPMILAPLPVIVMLVHAHRKIALVPLIAFWLTGALTFCPWLIRNTIWAHNPVFPEATKLFGNAHWSEAQVERWRRANHLPRADQQNLAGRVAAARDQIFSASEFGAIVFQQYSDGTRRFFPPLLLVLALISVGTRSDRQSIALSLLLIHMLLFWLFFTHLQSRFFVLSIPVCALLIGGRGDRIWSITCAGAAFIVCIAGVVCFVGKLDGINSRFQGKLYALTGLDQISILSRTPEDLGGRRLELVGDARAFLYEVPMRRLFYRTVFDVDAQPGQVARDAWQEGWPTGPDVVIVTDDTELERFHRTYWKIPPP